MTWRNRPAGTRAASAPAHPHAAVTHRPRSLSNPARQRPTSPFNSHPHHPCIEQEGGPSFWAQPQSRSVTGVEFARMFPETGWAGQVWRPRTPSRDRGHEIACPRSPVPVPAPGKIHRLPPGLVAGFVARDRAGPDGNRSQSPTPYGPLTRTANGRRFSTPVTPVTPVTPTLNSSTPSETTLRRQSARWSARGQGRDERTTGPDPQPPTVCAAGLTRSARIRCIA